MYTAKELLNAVRSEKDLPIINDGSPYQAVNTAMIEHANSGWLCLNASRYIYITRDVIDYYRSLGYHTDHDGIIYWIYEN